MDLQHINVKVFVDGDLPVGLDKFVEVFHRWTSEQSMEEMLIDVADYAHVPAGPGIVLIGHEADYALDHADERWGLLYNRKAVVDGDSLACLEQAFRAATHACALLEAEFAAEQLKFDRHRLRAVVNDRALAPNTAETPVADSGICIKSKWLIKHSNKNATRDMPNTTTKSTKL